MKISILQSTILCALCSHPIVATSATDEDLNKKIEAMEQRLEAVENQPDEKPVPSSYQVSSNDFNPAISVILDGVFASYKNNPEDYQLPGYALGREAGLSREGFSLGHSEISLSNYIDDKFFGQFTLALADHDGEQELEIEEAFSLLRQTGFQNPKRQI